MNNEQDWLAGCYHANLESCPGAPPPWYEHPSGRWVSLFTFPVQNISHSLVVNVFLLVIGVIAGRGAKEEKGNGGGTAQRKRRKERERQRVKD